MSRMVEKSFRQAEGSSRCGRSVSPMKDDLLLYDSFRLFRFAGRREISIVSGYRRTRAEYYTARSQDTARGTSGITLSSGQTPRRIKRRRIDFCRHSRASKHPGSCKRKYDDSGGARRKSRVCGRWILRRIARG